MHNKSSDGGKPLVSAAETLLVVHQSPNSDLQIRGRIFSAYRRRGHIPVNVPEFPPETSWPFLWLL